MYGNPWSLYAKKIKNGAKCMYTLVAFLQNKNRHVLLIDKGLHEQKLVNY
jgi:hypothetical protein